MTEITNMLPARRVEQTNCHYCDTCIIPHPSHQEPVDAAERRKLFHEPCDDCAKEDIRPNTCPYCTHLRIRHLAMCVPTESLNRWLFPLSEQEFTQQCPLCSLLQCATLGYWKRYCELFFGHLYAPTSDLPGGSRVVSIFHKNSYVGHLLLYDSRENRSGGTDRKVPNLIGGGKKVAWDRLRECMQECESKHTSCKPEADRKLPPHFRVIDVLQRRVVEIHNPRFICLSYVWGTSAMGGYLTASRSTIASMQEDGGLAANKVPQTIEDGMRACQELGERYLWVDRICVLQDVNEDKVEQINSMDAIYSQARLVIIAAHGKDMDSGIPGISHERDVIEKEDNLMGMRIIKPWYEFGQHRLAIWKTRGWTYQEAVMARRTLSFTKTRVHFACGRDNCQVEPFDHVDALYPPIRHNLSKTGEPQLVQFVRHLSEYSRRSLTYRSDVYNAFEGIHKSIYGATSSWIYGLPRVHFSQGLLWYQWRRTGPPMPFSESEPILPTWSWSSFNLSFTSRPGEHLCFYNETRSFCGTLCVWYTNTALVGPVALEAINTSHSSSDGDEDWQIPIAIAYSEGCIAGVAPCHSIKAETWSTIRSRYTHRWLTYGSFCREITSVSRRTCKDQMLEIYQEWTSRDLKPGALLGVTQLARFRLSMEWFKYFLFSIVDTEGRWIGQLCGSPQDETPYNDADMLYEFIAISVSRRLIREDEGPHVSSEKCFRDVSGISYPSPSENHSDLVTSGGYVVVDVIMVGWRGDYAYRRELGWIFLKDWIKAQREWKVIRIE